MLDEPVISEACYLMRLCEASLVPNELSERPRSALHDLIKEEPQRPQSALRDLLDPVTDQPKDDYRTSAFGNHLTGRIAGKN
jgi:hypothetical protein